MSQFQAAGTLTSALLANKGSAVPSSALSALLDELPRRTMEPRPEPELRMPRGVKTTPAPGERVKLSLRLDRKRHLRLKIAAAHLRLSSQAVLLAALDEYLSRAAPEIGGGDCACLAVNDAD